MKCPECNGKGHVIVYRPDEPCFICDGKGKVPDFAVVMLTLRNGMTKGEPVMGSENDEPIRWTLDGARQRVRGIKRVIADMPRLNFAKPNSIVRVYLK